MKRVSRTGAVFLSPNYTDLAGGGQTQKVYDGQAGPLRLTAVASGTANTTSTSA